MKTTNRAIEPIAVLEIIEWLVGDACHGLDDAGLLAGLGRRLRDAGLPIDRLTLHTGTLHPDILSRTVAWTPDQPAEICDREHGIEASTGFIGSPLQRVMETLEPCSVRLDDRCGSAWARLDAFRDRGLAELVVAPLCNEAGPVSAVAFGTARPGGFAAGERAALERIVPPLRTACELRILRSIELTLLDMHIERPEAERPLAGEEEAMAAGSSETGRR